MTGPEHYQEAEKSLAACGFDRAEFGGYDEIDDRTMAWLAAAQTHATLALAAAADPAIVGVAR